MSNQQYIVRKFVMAVSVQEALKKSKRVPIHEVYVDSSWLEKVRNNSFFGDEERRSTGFGKKLSTTSKKDIDN